MVDGALARVTLRRPALANRLSVADIEALQGLIAGDVELMFDGLGSSAQHIRSGAIRAIAQAADKPAPGFGQVPLAKDGGAPNYRVATWYGLWAPKGSSRESVQAMQAALRKALAREGANP